MREREDPLNDSELRWVRGMIDEYRYRQQRSAHWRELFSSAQGRLLFAIAVVQLLSLASHFWR